MQMCFPKAPKTDPSIIEEQERARQAELDRLAEEKEAATIASSRSLKALFGTGGSRSLLSGGGAGFGSNY
jgi:hypothetical protein